VVRDEGSEAEVAPLGARHLVDDRLSVDRVNGRACAELDDGHVGVATAPASPELHASISVALVSDLLVKHYKATLKPENSSASRGCPQAEATAQSRPVVRLHDRPLPRGPDPAVLEVSSEHRLAAAASRRALANEIENMEERVAPMPVP
jgi:hypothetical protein